MSAIIPISLPISKIEEIIEMDNASAGKVTCVGFAPSKRRRCLNPIAASNQGLARKTIDSLPHLLNNQSELLRALLHLASLTLCQRNHQDQARSTAQNWFRTIVQEASAQYTPLPRSISPPAYSSQVQPLYVAPAEVARYYSTMYTTTYTQRTHRAAQPPHQQYAQLRWQRDTIEYIAPIPQVPAPSTLSRPSPQRTLQPRARILTLPSPAESSYDPRTSSRTINVPASQAVITQPALPGTHTTHPPAPREPVNGSTEVTVLPPTPANRPVPSRLRLRSVEATAEVEALYASSSTTTTEDHSHDATSDDDAEDEATCYICYLPYTDPVSTPCGHKFCRECIGAWLANNRTCPYDRRPLQVAQLVAVVEVTCNICFEAFTTPCRTPCGHIFCRECITTWLRNGSRRTCPMDRRPLREADLVDLNEDEWNAFREG